MACYKGNIGLIGSTTKANATQVYNFTDLPSILSDDMVTISVLSRLKVLRTVNPKALILRVYGICSVVDFSQKCGFQQHMAFNWWSIPEAAYPLYGNYVGVV